jgi:hypothetical protein
VSIRHIPASVLIRTRNGLDENCYIIKHTAGYRYSQLATDADGLNNDWRMNDTVEHFYSQSNANFMPELAPTLDCKSRLCLTDDCCQL